MIAWDAPPKPAIIIQAPKELYVPPWSRRRRLGLTGIVAASLLPGAVATPILDQLSATSSVAYSLRKLRAAYAGNCLKIKRSSDSTTQNIGFLANGLWDAASALTFCGAGDGFIDTWYDQSGNAQNATAIGTAQPKIISSGSLITTLNTGGSIQYDGSVMSLTGTAGTNYLTTSAFTVFAAARVTGGSSTQMTNGTTVRDDAGLVAVGSGDWGLSFQSTGTGSPQMGSYIWAGSYNNFVVTPYTANSNASYMSRYDGTNQKIYSNGGTGASVAAGNIGETPSGVARIMANSGATVPLAGYLNEIIFFKTCISAADANILGANAASYWGLSSWANIS